MQNLTTANLVDVMLHTRGRDYLLRVSLIGITIATIVIAR
jgi:hypothetical protein